jgi:hypothetical protein
VTFEVVRQTFVTEMLAGIPVGAVATFDNDPFDWANAPSVFHHVRISFQAASQIGMSASPKTRDAGYVYLRTHVRQGLGSKPATEALDWYRTALEFKILSAPGVRITCEAMEPDGDPVEVRGWCIHDAKVFFRVHPAP